MNLRVVPVTPERWADMCTLFEQRGPRGGHRNTPAHGCWCMYWRDRHLAHGEPKKQAMAKLVGDGREPGLLAYDGEEPVGWVAIAPREEFHALVSSPQYGKRDEEEDVWSIACFVVDKPRWRTGVAGALLDAAVAHAFSHGASSVEAYPHAGDGRDYMGNVTLFEHAGFEKVRDANKRAIMRTKGMLR